MFRTNYKITFQKNNLDYQLIMEPTEASTLLLCNARTTPISNKGTHFVLEADTFSLPKRGAIKLH